MKLDVFNGECTASAHDMSLKEIKINPNIILEMAEKHKIPINPTKKNTPT